MCICECWNKLLSYLILSYCTIADVTHIFVTSRILYTQPESGLKDLRLDLRSWLPDIDQLRGWTELMKSPRADRPKGFGSALSFPEADLWQAAMSENQSQILL